MWCVFLVASSPELNPLPHFCTLLFFKYGNLSSSLAPLWGKIDIHTQGLSRTKFNFAQLLFEAFLIRCVFLAASSAKRNLLFPFWILVCIRRSVHSRMRLRCCLFSFMAWYVSICYVALPLGWCSRHSEVVGGGCCFSSQTCIYDRGILAGRFGNKTPKFLTDRLSYQTALYHLCRMVYSHQRILWYNHRRRSKFRIQISEMHLMKIYHNVLFRLLSFQKQ